MRPTLPLIAALVFSATRATAQQVQGSVTIAGGSATDVVGTTSRALSVSPGLLLAPDSHLLFGLGATGTRYDDQRWSVGGQASMAGRIPVGSHVAFTLNGGAGATGTSYDFSYVTGNALPAIEASAGAVTAYAGASEAFANTRSTRATPISPGLFGGTPVGSASAITTSRTSTGVVLGGNVRLLNQGGQSIVAGVRQVRAVVDTTTTMDRSATLSASSGRVTVGGAFGVRAERGSNATFGSGTMSLAVDPRFAIELAGGSYPSDPLVGTPGGRYLTLGVSLRTSHSVARPPSTDGVPAPVVGVTRLTIRDADARRVDVAGDFSNWKLVPATRAPNGVWFADIRIPPGQYRYAFRIDGATWAVPSGAAAVDDGFGGKSAWLTISDPPSGTAR